MSFMDTQTNQRVARAFAGSFAASLAQSLTEAAGAPWMLEVLESPDLSTQQGQAIHYRLTLDGELHGSLFVEFAELQARELASKIAGAPVPAFGDQHEEALEKALSSAMAGMAASSNQYGSFTCVVERVTGLAFGGMLLVPVTASEAEQPGMPVTLYFDGPLLSELAVHVPVDVSAEGQKSSMDALNLGLVLDVELSVSLRFGQRQLPLHEVLELGSGSVIELDRQVDDPVELLLDGKVIARGEAVIVDGNYGLRVTEIPQPIASHFVR
jgi:flagellar motor switch protein FliN/FliY